MLVNVNGIHYVHVCEQARWAHSAGNSAIENWCIIIIIIIIIMIIIIIIITIWRLTRRIYRDETWRKDSLGHETSKVACRFGIDNDSFVH